MLYVFIMQYIFMAVCEQIDAAFINNIGIDAVCVLSAFTPIEWTVSTVAYMGVNGYRTLLKDRINCMTVGIISSLAVAALVLSASGAIPLIYSLTDRQNKLFTRCLIMYAFGIVFESLSELIYEWLLLEGRSRFAIAECAVLYAMTITSDWVVWHNGYSLEYFLLATTLCYGTHTTVLLFISGFLTKEKIELSKMKIIATHAARVAWNGITGKVATVFYNIYASRLSSELYAVHAVCYRVCTESEAVSRAVQLYTVKYLSEFKSCERLMEAWKLLKRNYIQMAVITYTFAFTMVILIHGKVGLAECISYTVIYELDMMVLLFSVIYEGYLQSVEATHVLKNGGVIGILVRIPVTLVLWKLGTGILGFALPCTIDFTARAIYFYRQSLKIGAGLESSNGQFKGDSADC